MPYRYLVRAGGGLCQSALFGALASFWLLGYN